MTLSRALSADPWALFEDWYAQAQRSEPAYPDAMSLATISADGMPTIRTVLMKDFDASSGLTFFTNRESRKGRELTAHPKACIHFYWKSLQRQVRVEGTVTPVSDTESDAYFATRPRGSQIGAWASQQSLVLESRDLLEQRVASVEKKYQGQAVPRPAYWGGYLLIPTYFEFWQEQQYRLHDRVAYHHNSSTANWSIERLYP